MGSVKPSRPEKGASVLGLLYNVYFIKPGDSLSVQGKSLGSWQFQWLLEMIRPKQK